MEKALSNTLTAVNNGVTWVDSTINGMGRGPGNVNRNGLNSSFSIQKKIRYEKGYWSFK